MATKEKSRKRNETNYGKVTEEKLRAALDKDAADGKIAAYKNNQINRKHYARQLGWTKQSITKFRHVFQEYERKYNVSTNNSNQIPEMYAWLNKMYGARKLELRGERIDRSQFVKYFCLKSDFFWRIGVEINEYFKVLDERARNEGYISLKTQNELEHVKSILKNDAPLLMDRLTVSVKPIIQKTGISKSRLQSKLFSELISEHQLEILSEAKKNKINPYINGKVYVFSKLESLWPKLFLERLGNRFKQISAKHTLKHTTGNHSHLVIALQWIGSSRSPLCRKVVEESIEHGRVISQDTWEDTLYLYREHIIESSVSDVSANDLIMKFRGSILGLDSGGLIPTMSLPIPGFKREKNRAKRLRSFAEAKNLEQVDSKDRYIEFADNVLFEAFENITLSHDSAESKEFINSLSVELKSCKKIAKDPATAIRNILEFRLGALRKHAIKILDESICLYEKGQKYLAASKMDSEFFINEYHYCSSKLDRRKMLVNEYFPRHNVTTQEYEQGLANLLGFIDQQFSGIPPARNEHGAVIKGQFFSRKYNEYGGAEKIAAMMNPSTKAVRAALTLYLIETGANVSVGRNLDRNCIEKSDLKGHHRITGFKARAQGKPIIVDLESHSPAVRAIEWLLEEGSRLQAQAESDSDKLFLSRIGGKSVLLGSASYREWFINFSQSIPGLENIHLVPNMIRPSVLLLATLSNDGRLAAGRALGQHGLGVTQGYQQKWPVRLIYDENIRRFHNAFETLIVSGVADAASRLNITVEQFEARIGNLRSTGLGTYCRDARGRPEDGTNSCKKMDCWNNCPNILIVPEVEEIANLQLWQTSLREVQPEWERDHPERWEKVWLPWLCLVDVVQEKMARGRYLKIWNLAIKRANELSNQAGYVPPKPW